MCNVISLSFVTGYFWHVDSLHLDVNYTIEGDRHKCEQNHMVFPLKMQKVHFKNLFLFSYRSLLVSSSIVRPPPPPQRRLLAVRGISRAPQGRPQRHGRRPPVRLPPDAGGLGAQVHEGQVRVGRGRLHSLDRVSLLARNAGWAFLKETTKLHSFHE